MKSDELSAADTVVGRQPVLEALRSGRPINRILLAHDVGRHSVVAEILQLARQKHIPVEYVPGRNLDDAARGSLNQGVLAFAAAKDYIDLAGLLDRSRQRGEEPLYCILDGIEDPQNLGAILRTADAAGVHGVVVRSRRAVGLTAGVSRASAGAIEYVPVARVANIAQTIEQLKQQNIWVVGVDRGGPLEFTQVDYTCAVALVIGGEGAGLSDLVKRRCDMIASIPMKGEISSLNASVAAALVMYEAFRQRRPAER
jgi:23S rRNA (guanosine2251-2'-O)-methyltransferase